MSRRKLLMDCSCMCSGDQNYIVLVGREGQLFLGKREKLFMCVVVQFHCFVKMILHVCGVFLWNESKLPSLHSRKHNCSWDHVTKTEYSCFSN